MQEDANLRSIVGGAPLRSESRAVDRVRRHDQRPELGRDLRTGGAWTRRQRLKNDVLYTLATLSLAVCRALPLSVLRRVGFAVGAAAQVFASDARRIALDNVARVFPELPDAERRVFVRRSFLTMGELLADAVALLRKRAGPLLDLAPGSRAVLDEALRDGRGVVFASAHLGPWERVAASLVAAGVPFVTLARESYDPRLTRLYEKLRRSRGVRTVWRPGAGTMATTTAILRALRDGCVLGLPMDLRSRVASCDAPFLGHPASTPVGPARLALRTGAALVVGTAMPGVVGGPPLVISATRISKAGLDPSTEGGARELTARINLELSSRILAFPHAWVWMHDRWPVRRSDGDTLAKPHPRQPSGEPE